MRKPSVDSRTCSGRSGIGASTWLSNAGDGRLPPSSRWTISRGWKERPLGGRSPWSARSATRGSCRGFSTRWWRAGPPSAGVRLRGFDDRDRARHRQAERADASAALVSARCPPGTCSGHRAGHDGDHAWREIAYGARKAGGPALYDRALGLLRGVTILDFGREATERYGGIRLALERAGLRLPIPICGSRPSRRRPSRCSSPGT